MMGMGMVFEATGNGFHVPTVDGESFLLSPGNPVNVVGELVGLYSLTTSGGGGTKGSPATWMASRTSNRSGSWFRQATARWASSRDGTVPVTVATRLRTLTSRWSLA